MCQCNYYVLNSSNLLLQFALAICLCIEKRRLCWTLPVSMYFASVRMVCKVSKRESPYPMCLPGDSTVKKCSNLTSAILWTWVVKALNSTGVLLRQNRCHLALNRRSWLGHIIGFRGGKAGVDEYFSVSILMRSCSSKQGFHIERWWKFEQERVILPWLLQQVVCKSGLLEVHFDFSQDNGYGSKPSIVETRCNPRTRMQSLT